MGQPSALDRSKWKPIDTLNDSNRAVAQQISRAQSLHSVENSPRRNTVSRGIEELVHGRCATASQPMSVPPSPFSPTLANYGTKKLSDKPLPRRPSGQFDLPIRAALFSGDCHRSERCPRILRIVDRKPATGRYEEMFKVEFAECVVSVGYIQYSGAKPFISGKQNKKLWITEISDTPWQGAEGMKRVSLRTDWLSALQLQGVSGAMITEAREQFNRPREAIIPDNGTVTFIPEPECDYSTSFAELVKRKTAEADKSCQWLAFEHHQKVRPLVFHDNFCLPVNLSISYKFRSCFIHQVGAARSPPCRHCREKAGPFLECVVKDGFFNGACTNCAFRKINTKCDHHANASEKRSRKSGQVAGKKNVGLADTTQPETPATQLSATMSSYIDDDARDLAPSDATWTPITTPASTFITAGVPTPQTILPLTPSSSSPCPDVPAASDKRKKRSYPSREIGLSQKKTRRVDLAHVSINSTSAASLRGSSRRRAQSPVVAIPPPDANGNTAREAIQVLSPERPSSESEHESEMGEGNQQNRRRHPLRRRRCFPLREDPTRVPVYADDPDFDVSEASVPQIRFILDHCPKSNREWFTGAWESWLEEHRQRRRSIRFSCEEEYLRAVWPVRLEEILGRCCLKRRIRDADE